MKGFPQREAFFVSGLFVCPSLDTIIVFIDCPLFLAVGLTCLPQAGLPRGSLLFKYSVSLLQLYFMINH